MLRTCRFLSAENVPGTLPWSLGFELRSKTTSLVRIDQLGGSPPREESEMDQAERVRRERSKGGGEEEAGD
jgi:hypothetical protein